MTPVDMLLATQYVRSVWSWRICEDQGKGKDSAQPLCRSMGQSWYQYFL